MEVDYKFEYDYHEADVHFKVDTEKFTKEMAYDTLNFFTWDYDEDEDPIYEVMKKYAMEAIRIATFNNYNEFGVIDEFNDNEGFYRIDGSYGITLVQINGYEFDTDKLTLVA